MLSIYPRVLDIFQCQLYQRLCVSIPFFWVSSCLRLILTSFEEQSISYGTTCLGRVEDIHVSHTAWNHRAREQVSGSWLSPEIAAVSGSARASCIRMTASDYRETASMLGFHWFLRALEVRFNQCDLAMTSLNGMNQMSSYPWCPGGAQAWPQVVLRGQRASPRPGWTRRKAATGWTGRVPHTTWLCLNTGMVIPLYHVIPR